MSKMYLRRGDKRAVLSNLSIYYTLKKMKNQTGIANSKYQEQDGVRNLNSLLNFIPCQIFKTILST